MTLRLRFSRRAAVAGALVLAALTAAPGLGGSAAVAADSPCTASDQGSSSIDGAVSAPTPDQVLDTEVVHLEAGGFHYKNGGLFDDRRVTRVDAVILACDGQTLPEGSSKSVNTGDPGSITWDTPALKWNGHYAMKVTATATGSSADVKRVIVRPFALAVDAAPPKNLQVALGSDGVSVIASWDKNTEPDLAGYLLEWTLSGDTSFSKATQATVDPASDTGGRVAFTTKPGPGSWRYRVSAVRAGASTAPADLRQSKPTTAATSVTIDEPTTTTTAGSGASTGGSTGGSTAGSDTGSGSTASGSDVSTAKSSPKLATAGKIDLSSFSALLDQRRKATPKPVEADPGYNETLPFNPKDEPALADEGGDQELGADSGSVTSRLVSDDSDRRRAMSFVAGALLFFVLAMQLRWIKAEVDRVPDLEPAPFDDIEQPTESAAEVLAAEEGLTAAAVAAAAASAVPAAPPAANGDGSMLDVPLPRRDRRRERAERRVPVG